MLVAEYLFQVSSFHLSLPNKPIFLTYLVIHQLLPIKPISNPKWINICHQIPIINIPLPLFSPPELTEVVGEKNPTFKWNIKFFWFFFFFCLFWLEENKKARKEMEMLRIKYNYAKYFMSNILAYKRNKKAFGKITYRFFKVNMSYKKVFWIIQACSFLLQVGILSDL